MKVQKATLLSVVAVLVIAILACGSSGVEVNEPSNAQVETAMAEIQEPEGEAPVEEAPEVEAPEVEEPEIDVPEIGTARSNPAPVGSEVITDDMAFVVQGFTRPATDIVMAGNQFNTEPEPGQEYVFVQLQVSCLLSVDDQCSINSFNFSLLGSAGVSRDPEIFVSGVDGLLEFSTDFYGEAIIAGTMPFIVASDETDLLLVYEPFLGDTFYLALE